MQYISFQSCDIPLAYVTGLSYSKRARLVTNARGFSRFRGFEAAEISLRLNVNRAAALVSDSNIVADMQKIFALEAVKDSEPTQVVVADHILYPSLMFRVSTITKTVQADHTGRPIAMEADITLSGVECAKGETERRALSFTPEEQIELPNIVIECQEKTYQVGNDSTVSILTLRPDSADVEIILGNDSAIVNDAPWLLSLAQKKASVTIGDYGRFWIVSANLVEGILSLTGSRWPAQEAETQTFMDTDLSVILKSIVPTAKVMKSGKIGYYLKRGTPLQAVVELQQSAGFLIDYSHDWVTFVSVPDYITPSVDFSLYLDDDIATERITGLRWDDGWNEFTVDGPAMVAVHSCFRSDSAKHPVSCLDYARYMQNWIQVTIPYDSRIRHHSAVTVIKGAKYINCMVEGYEIDFVGGQMTLDLHYVAR